MSRAHAIVRRPLAEVDIVEAALYIAANNRSAARRFVQAVQATSLQIVAYPGSGVLVPAADARLQGCRSWAVAGFENWRIYYRETPDGVEVVRVLHAARDLDSLE